jgi:hypothetical protein
MENVPSQAAQVVVSVIPIVGIVMGCGVIFFYLLWNYRLKCLMIERDLLKTKPFDLDSFSLFAGLILLSIGFSLMLFFVLKDGLSYGVLSGLIPLSIGISLIVFFLIRNRMNKTER